MFDELLIKVIILRFYNKLKFHILSRDAKIIGLSPHNKMSISSKSGRSTFVLSTIGIPVVLRRTDPFPTMDGSARHPLKFINQVRMPAISDGKS